jgi:hypothetical protein
MSRLLRQAYRRKAPALATIERASMDAYVRPSEEAVKASVARPTEGAAPNSPAKLFGFNTSPSAAKNETARPPIKKRKKSSVMKIPQPEATVVCKI